MRSLLFPSLLAFAAVACAQVEPADQTQSTNEEQTIRNSLARFYEGWNAHDPEKMLSNSQKKHVVEKVRFLMPDVTVVRWRGSRHVGPELDRQTA